MRTAASQTAGRGRGGNRWWTGPGSLAFSLLTKIDTAEVVRGSVPLAALAAGITVVEAVRPLLSERSVGLHWPNDVYVDKRKLAGILIESPSPDRLVVGVGINTNCRLADAPEELRERVRDAIDQLSEIDQEVLMQRYLEQLSSQEIAASLGISENAVNKRHVRALMRMRNTLSKDHE